jgi:hypothetical protein
MPELAGALILTLTWVLRFALFAPVSAGDLARPSPAAPPRARTEPMEAAETR